MPQRLYGLTAEDRKVLLGLLDEVKRGRRNPTLRPGPAAPLATAPEVFVARIPPEGVPALTVTLLDDPLGFLLLNGYGALGFMAVGDGTDELIQPGSGECVIYCIDDTDLSNPFLEITAVETKTVYNVFGVAAPGDEWLPVARDKFGNWLLTGIPPTAADTSDTAFVRVLSYARSPGGYIHGKACAYAGLGSDGTPTFDDAEDCWVLDANRAQLSLGDWFLARRVDTAAAGSAGTGTGTGSGAGTWPVYLPETDRMFPAQITGGNGDGLYSWVEQKPAGGGLTDHDDARSGVYSAYELNGNANVPTTAYVFMWPAQSSIAAPNSTRGDYHFIYFGSGRAGKVLDVGEEDGDPLVENVNTILFHQDDGFKVIDLGAGQAIIRFGAGSATGTGDGDCDPLEIELEQVRCEGGQLNVYVRTDLVTLVAGCLVREEGDWLFDHNEGACGSQAINVTNIYEFTTYVQGAQYFNYYDQQIYINFGGTWVVICPCYILPPGTGTGTGTGTGPGSGPADGPCPCDDPQPAVVSVLIVNVSGAEDIAGPYNLLFQSAGDWEATDFGGAPIDDITLVCDPTSNSGLSLTVSLPDITPVTGTPVGCSPHRYDFDFAGKEYYILVNTDCCTGGCCGWDETHFPPATLKITLASTCPHLDGLEMICTQPAGPTVTQWYGDDGDIVAVVITCNRPGGWSLNITCFSNIIYTAVAGQAELVSCFPLRINFPGQASPTDTVCCLAGSITSAVVVEV